MYIPNLAGNGNIRFGTPLDQTTSKHYSPLFKGGKILSTKAATKSQYRVAKKHQSVP